MPTIIEGPPEPGDPSPPLWSKLAWFAGLAVASGLAVAVVAYAMKAVIPG
jgi:hypothetical protein